MVNRAIVHALAWLLLVAPIHLAASPLSFTSTLPPDPGDVVYEGLDGYVVRGDGGVALALTENEALFVVVVDDARRAAFSPPTRVLHRAEHEVLVATSAAVPDVVDGTADGFCQVVLVDPERRRGRGLAGIDKQQMTPCGIAHLFRVAQSP